ncbi:MAG: thioredoxin-disulfide reductase [Eubacterium sp.]|nr:thioredoxin-disulfide reductase [Eubacterium sp.]
MYDIIIIGAGPAGLSAAIYARRSGKSVLVLEEKTYGGQIVNTPNIENYPGIAHISGFEFATNLYNQAKDFGAEFKFEKAVGIEDREDSKLVKTPKDEYEAKAVIIATGAKNRKLGIDNEDSLVGKGISYCATCDGMFFRDKDVAVNGGGNTAVEDAMFLSNYCNKVYIIHRRDEFRADDKDVERLKEKDNVELVLDSTVSEILSDTDEAGNEHVSGVKVKNKNTGDERVLDVNGLFIAIGQVPDNEDFKDIVELENGYVKALEDCKTDTQGIYVAGDCRTKSVRQLATAASDGAIAAIAASQEV